MSSVIEHARSTVAVSTPEKLIPVPGDARIPGFTTTMYAIVKKVVMPPMTSPEMLGWWLVVGGWWWFSVRGPAGLRCISGILDSQRPNPNFQFPM